MRQSRGDVKKEFKLLLLGTGESGKSTILKQMQIIYGEGFDDMTRQGYTALVYRNILRPMKALFNAYKVLGIAIEDGTVLADLEKIYALRDDDFTSFDSTQAALFTSLWKDKDVQAICERRSEFGLPDSTL